jgi:DNA adenine methylase
MSKPIIKWVGGKRQLLAELTGRLPTMQIKHYVEPFFGGGALFFQIWEHLDSAHISDMNSELVSLYSAVKNNPYDLISTLKNSIFTNDPEHFRMVRNWDHEPDYNKRPPEARAARFIYLNKTGFNGLYRVNKSGKFNVPFGRHKNPKICDEDTILEAHKAFKHTQISTRSFHCVQFDFHENDPANEDAFVYFDPPYVPMTATANFTSYTTDGFNHQHQIELKNVCDHLTKIGVKWMQSNSYTPVVLDLYKDYNIDEVQARRSVNSDAKGRGKVSEAIIRNYK